MVLGTGQYSNIFGNLNGFNLMGTTCYCSGYGTGSYNIGNFLCGSWNNMLYQSQNAVANGAYNMSTSLASGITGLFTAFCVTGIDKGISDAKANSYSGKTKTGEEIQKEIDTKLQELGTGRTEENYADYKITDDKVYTDAHQAATDEKNKATQAKTTNQAGYDKYLEADNYIKTNSKTEENKAQYENMEAQSNANKAAYEAWLKADEEESAADKKLKAIENGTDSTIKERIDAIVKTKNEITELIAERKQIMNDIVEKASKDGKYSKDLVFNSDGSVRMDCDSKASDLQKAINHFKKATTDEDRLAAQKRVRAIYAEYTGTKENDGQNKTYSSGIETAYRIVDSWRDTDNDLKNNNGAYSYKFGV